MNSASVWLTHRKTVQVKLVPWTKRTTAQRRSWAAEHCELQSDSFSASWDLGYKNEKKSISFSSWMKDKKTRTEAVFLWLYKLRNGWFFPKKINFAHKFKGPTTDTLYRVKVLKSYDGVRGAVSFLFWEYFTGEHTYSTNKQINIISNFQHYSIVHWNLIISVSFKKIPVSVGDIWVCWVIIISHANYVAHVFIH